LDAQKAGASARILVLPALEGGETMSGTVVSSRSSGVIVRFGEVELRAQPQAGSQLPESGSLVHVQLQLQAGKAVLYLLSSSDDMASDCHGSSGICVQIEQGFI
jgi:hypothetical protein